MQHDWTKQAVLITGGAGFIGSSLARCLVERGARVVCLDVDPSFERLRDLKDHPRLDCVVGDVRDQKLVDSLVANATAIAHMASVVGVHRYLDDPAEVLDVSIIGGRNILRACAEHGKPVLVASTSEVYGANPTKLHEQSARLYGPVEKQRWSYATAKGAVDQYAMALRGRGLQFGIVRYFNVYGPTADEPGKGRVVSSFVGAIRDGRPLPLVDGGNAIRCFCYIDDAVRATLAFLGQIGQNPQVTGKVINVGRAEPVTMRMLAERMVDLAHHQPGTVDVSGSNHFGVGFEEIPRRIPDLDRMHTLLGCTAETSLQDGLQRVLRHWDLLRSPSPVAPTQIPHIRPHLEPSFDLLLEISEVLHSGQLTNHGPRVRRLEAEVSRFLGSVPTLATTSGSTALDLAFGALSPLVGTAVLPAFTYVATLNAVVRAGLQPIFCDIDLASWTLSADHLKELMASRSDIACIVPVNVFGVPPDLSTICSLAGNASIPVIYDNAHGFGTEVDGRRYHEGPTVSTMSFHATKVFAAGEAGALLTRDGGLLKRAAQVRNHGTASESPDWLPGLNGKLSEVQAVIALHELGRMDDVLAKRRRYYDRLVSAFRNLGPSKCEVQHIPAGVRPNGQNLAVRFPWLQRERHDEVISAFGSAGVGTRAYFSPMLHRLAPDSAGSGSLQNTECLEEQLLCLPLHSRMSEVELGAIEQAVADIVQRFGPQG